MMKSVVVIGASASAIQETVFRTACCNAVVLVGRNKDELVRAAARARAGGAFDVRIIQLDLANGDADMRATIADLMSSIHQAIAEMRNRSGHVGDDDGHIDLMLLAHGEWQPAHCWIPDTVGRVLMINTVATAYIASHWLASIEHEPTRQSQLVVLGSLAGRQGMARNGAYSASKAALRPLIDGLQAELERRRLPHRVGLVELGRLNCGMTNGSSRLLPLGDGYNVLWGIQAILDGRKTHTVAPGYWRWLAPIMRLLPRSFLNRMDALTQRRMP